ncbi:MAG: UDP-2,3-diacylglucosamine diphosphatase LpxI [Gammaproteobacteria bacterium]|nr:UDP-2,3-diacylglucosamine diphosphatase LpxI [Gammaproteobacteria bacterium]MCI0591506.1 UDP-2,3-diacylglucosamine diphosphatase LpxI [Gammaproteobacteria bacterium]
MPPKLGIIAGGGELPASLISICRATGREFFVLAVDGYTDPKLVEDLPHAWTRLGAFETSIQLLRGAGVEELVLAGHARRPSFSGMMPDARLRRLLLHLGFAASGDDGLLSGVIKEFEEEGFRVVGLQSIIGDVLAVEGVYTKCEPDEQARLDIARGVKVARALGAEDVGQSVVVQHGMVLGVEAIEGTDALLARCGTLKRDGPGGVLVKVKKPVQERRVDLPTIGLSTVHGAAGAGLRGIAIEAGGSLVVDRRAVTRAADAAGLFIMGITLEA